MEPGDWPQAVIEFIDWPGSEQVAVEHLHPALTAAQADGVISRWWFIRKAMYGARSPSTVPPGTPPSPRSAAAAYEPPYIGS